MKSIALPAYNNHFCSPDTRYKCNMARPIARLSPRKGPASSYSSCLNPPSGKERWPMVHRAARTARCSADLSPVYSYNVANASIAQPFSREKTCLRTSGIPTFMRCLLFEEKYAEVSYPSILSDCAE